MKLELFSTPIFITNIDLDNENTIINGVSLSAGSIVLLKNQIIEAILK